MVEMSRTEFTELGVPGEDMKDRDQDLVRCRNGPCTKLWLGRAAVPTVMV
jgi:hypothetical protein